VQGFYLLTKIDFFYKNNIIELLGNFRDLIMKNFFLLTFLITPLFGMKKNISGDSKEQSHLSLALSKSKTYCDFELFEDLSDQLKQLEIQSLPTSPTTPLSPPERYHLHRKKAALHKCLRQLHSSPIPESSVPKEDSDAYGPIRGRKKQ